jgi:hypothetical protein
MMYSQLSLTSLLLLHNVLPSCHSFIIPSRQSLNNNIQYRHSHPMRDTESLYASTLEEQAVKNELRNDNKDNDNNDSTIAVSSNHIFVWDDKSNDMIIKECNEFTSYSRKNNVSLMDGIEYEQYEEEKNEKEIGHDDFISSSLSSSSSTAMNNNSNGIKMTNSNDIQLLQYQEKMKMGEESTPTTTITDSKSNSSSKTETSSKTSLSDRIANSGVASAAAMATAAVNAAVSMKTLEAPSTTKSYISLDTSQTVIDEDGLPLKYDKDAIEQYWKKERGALNKRWGYFVSKAVPFLTRLTTLFIKDGKIDDKYIPELSEQARVDLQDLGPTFIKAGQMMSVRPDVLPQVSHIFLILSHWRKLFYDGFVAHLF